MPVAGRVRFAIVVPAQSQQAALHQQRPIALLRIEAIALRVLFSQSGHHAHGVADRISELFVQEVLERFGAFVEDAHVLKGPAGSGGDDQRLIAMPLC